MAKDNTQKEHPLMTILKGILLLIIVILGCFTVMVSILLVVTGSSVSTLLSSASTVLSAGQPGLMETIAKNPEIGIAMATANSWSGTQDKAILYSIAKQMSADGKVDMTFNANFTTTVYRKLEKKDLTCVDAFEYMILRNDSIIQSQRAVDNGCTKFYQDSLSLYFKCPTHNCEMIEVDELQPGTIIPLNLQVRTVQVAINEKK